MPFEFHATGLAGLTRISPRCFSDDRGFFMETYKQSDFLAAGINATFVQDNHSFSQTGVLRGLHFQLDPKAQGKLIRVISGAVWDVAVDLRPSSTTHGEWEGFELTAENGDMLYIPPGFAHGFLTLADNTHFLYKCTQEYSPVHDAGIRWDDPDLAIDWPLRGQVPVVSYKDQKLPLLKEFQ